jgi:hypothetical protein
MIAWNSHAVKSTLLLSRDGSPLKNACDHIRLGTASPSSSGKQGLGYPFRWRTPNTLWLQEGEDSPPASLEKEEPGRS